MMAVVGTLTFNFPVVIPLFVERTLHGTDGSYTLLYSVLSVGSVDRGAGRRPARSIEIRHVVHASVAFGVAMLVFAAAPEPGLRRSRSRCWSGFTSIAFMTASTAIVQVRSEPAMRGRVLALQAIVFIGSTPIGGPLLGCVCDGFGARAGLVVGGGRRPRGRGVGLYAGRRAMAARRAAGPDQAEVSRRSGRRLWHRRRSRPSSVAVS